ncbi:MAG: SRPBCC family protein [Casimicrobiaceae bacterium]
MTTINVEVQRTIRRPVAVVSRQFGDIRHHEQDRVHPDVKFTVLSQDGDTCRFRQQVKLVGMLQTDEVMQHRNADGSLSWEVVDGANKGMRIHQGFTAVGADETRVTFRAEAPATGIKRLLKPLFEVAIRKAVNKGLEEDRVDLEERGYGMAASTSTLA